MHDTARPQTTAAAELNESAFLGTCLRDFDDARCRDALARLTADHFTDPQHQAAFAILRADLGRADANPLLDFSAAYAQTTRLDAEAGGERFRLLIDRAVPSDNIDHYAGKLDQAHRLRMLARQSRIITGEIEGGGIDDPEAYLAGAVERIGEAAMPATVNRLDVINAGEWLEQAQPETEPILANLIEPGDKVLIAGAPKSRKTFFAAQLACCLTSGRDFMAWKVPRPFRVLSVQMEVKPEHFHRRLCGMLHALHMTPSDIGDRLAIVNGRGKVKDIGDIVRLVAAHKPEVVIIDPLYKLIEDESNPALVTAFLAAIDRMAQDTGAAVLYVHHHAKGNGGDRNTRDRASGSGRFARDYDAAFDLTRHAVEENAIVLEADSRNFIPEPPFVIRFENGCFIAAPDLVATVRTTTTAKNEKTPARDDQILAMIEDEGPMPVSCFDARVHGMGGSCKGATAVRDRLLHSGKLNTAPKVGRHGHKLIGTPSQIAEIRRPTA